jgi:hypothetical protein
MDHRQSLPLAALILDADVQPRETMSSGLIHEYATLYREGHALPPIKVFHDGRDNWVADGFHRVSAVREAGLSEIHAEVAPGTKRDAILYACGANKHGKPRSHADKRRAVLRLLEDPTWQQWSDHEMARHCGVDHKTVARWRKVVTREIPSERTYQTKHGTRGTMDTSHIGARAVPEPQEAFPTRPVDDVAAGGVNPGAFGRQARAGQEGQPEVGWNPVSIEEAMPDEAPADDISRTAIEARFTGSAAPPVPTMRSPAPTTPCGPLPQEQAADEPSVRWDWMLHELSVQVNRIRDHGGIGPMVRRWSLRTTRGYVEDLQRVQAVLHSLEEELLEVITQEEAGSQAPEASGHGSASTHAPEGESRDGMPSPAEGSAVVSTDALDEDRSVEREGTAGGSGSEDPDEAEGRGLFSKAHDTHGPMPSADDMSSPVQPTAAEAEGLREGGGATGLNLRIAPNDGL